MNDLERAFRDALRRADTVQVPVSPIDPAELAGRTRRQPPWQTILASAAAVTLVAGIGIVIWANVWRGIPAAPGSTPLAAATTVEVDVFSGRENPVVELEPTVADELYAMLGDQSHRLQDGEPRIPGLGFRGFVVTPAEADRPRLRVQAGAVYLIEAEDKHQRLLDPDRVFYQIIMDGIRDSLSEDVIKAIGEPEIVLPDPSEPGEPSDGPEQVGDAATWELMDPGAVGPDSTEITIGVTRLGCNSGVTGELLEPVVGYTDSRVIVRVDAAPIDDDRPRTCQGNDVVPVVVKLAEPIGDRELVDAACLAGEAVSTSFCEGSPVRWKP